MWQLYKNTAQVEHQCCTTLNTSLTWTWKTAGALVSSNEMTRYSKCTGRVLKAAFHWSPSLIRTTWWEFLRSNLVNRVAPWKGLRSRCKCWQWILVPNSDVDQTLEDDTREKSLILLRNKEKPSTKGRWGETDKSCSQRVIDVPFDHSSFWTRQIVPSKEAPGRRSRAQSKGEVERRLFPNHDTEWELWTNLEAQNWVGKQWPQQEAKQISNNLSGKMDSSLSFSQQASQYVGYLISTWDGQAPVGL